MNVRFIANKIQPSPMETTYWVDLSADPYGGVIKAYNGETWEPITEGGEDGDGTVTPPVDVINNLNSTSTTSALSANQGKVLNDKITAINNDIDDIIEDLDNSLILHDTARGDLSAVGASASVTFDGINGTITNTDGTFLNMEFTSNTTINNVLLVRTVYAPNGNASTRLENQTLGSTPVSFPQLTVGANPKIEVDICTPTNIYHITAFGSSNLKICVGYVEKL